SKVLANRLQLVLPSIISNNQAAYIKGRSISDNILLTQELLYGYERKNISPRCMLKLDIKKAFDSIAWP
ncbi:reverse transcriptase domain-containing protein, partial [Salmonella enterica]|uniref:reverse transcriptase domain-containing protein n=1 Tax=Salmonella enterica TaxID=28901 RepID=UPI003CEDC84E